MRQRSSGPAAPGSRAAIDRTEKFSSASSIAASSSTPHKSFWNIERRMRNRYNRSSALRRNPRPVRNRSRAHRSAPAGAGRLPAQRRVLDTPEIGDFRGADLQVCAGPPGPAPPQYRFVAWNVERGAQFEGQVEVLRTHPFLREADVLLLTETDAGMVRSGNRNVARDVARALGMH